MEIVLSFTHIVLSLESAGVPKETSSILNLVDDVNRYRDQQPLDAPIVVHCRYVMYARVLVYGVDLNHLHTFLIGLIEITSVT